MKFWAFADFWTQKSWLYFRNDPKHISGHHRYRNFTCQSLQFNRCRQI